MKIIILLMSLFSLPALGADEKISSSGTRNGGSNTAAEFSREVDALLADLQSHSPVRIGQIDLDLNRLVAIFSGTKVFAQQTPIVLDGIEFDARNDPERNEIYFNEQRWRGKSADDRRLLVAHELWGLTMAPLGYFDLNYQHSRALLLAAEGKLANPCTVYLADVATARLSKEAERTVPLADMEELAAFRALGYEPVDSKIAAAFEFERVKQTQPPWTLSNQPRWVFLGRPWGSRAIPMSSFEYVLTERKTGAQLILPGLGMYSETKEIGTELISEFLIAEKRAMESILAKVPACSASG